MLESYTYAGDELRLFAVAANWKDYFRSRLLPYIGGDVLEVGAGLGATTQHLCTPGPRSWTCLEPDAELAKQLVEVVRNADLPLPAEIVVGTTGDLTPTRLFDTILYIDVLEHIEEDAAELRTAAQHLRPGGHLIVLSPAHQWLFSPFDKVIGHYRRYTRASLQAVAPEGLLTERLFYLDSIGFFASLANRVLLRQQYPTVQQIRAWDRYLVPVSRRVDGLLGYRAGKTVVGVWRQP